MKELYIYRHAKSSWDDETLDDFERPLSKRGRRAALDMAQWMIAGGYQSDLVLCSGATRAHQTWQRLKSAGFVFGKHETSSLLYMASLPELNGILHNTPDTVSSLMIIGHNPGLQMWIKSLISCLNGDKKTVSSLQMIMDKFPTAGFLHIKFDVTTWRDIAPLSGVLYCYMTPKLLMS